MRKILIPIALAAFALSSAAADAASERDAVMSIIHQWIDAANRGDERTFVALCAEQATIFDDFSPYKWQAPDACSSWWRDAHKDPDTTDFVLTVGRPLQIYMETDRAYVVTRDSITFKVKGEPMRQTGSIHTFVLEKSSAGWRITGKAWADTAPAAPIKARS